MTQEASGSIPPAPGAASRLSFPDSPPQPSCPPDIIVYGTVCLDRFQHVNADGIPLDPEPEALPGGEAFNTATLLAGWGLNVLLTGTAVGNDPEGLRLQDLLDSHPLALPHEYVPVHPDAVTPSCLISVYPDGERRMQGKGFARAMAPPPLPDAVLLNRPIYTMDPNLGEPAVIACRRAAAFGCPIIGMDAAHLAELVPLCRIVVTSEDAFVRFFGAEGNRLAPDELAERLLEQGAQTAIITRGKEGCFVRDQEEGSFVVPAYSLPNIVDTTGAGDAFRAGLCYGLRSNYSLRRAVQFATAAAALHCQVRGGGSRLPLDTVHRLSSGT